MVVYLGLCTNDLGINCKMDLALPYGYSQRETTVITNSKIMLISLDILFKRCSTCKCRHEVYTMFIVSEQLLEHIYVESWFVSCEY